MQGAWKSRIPDSERHNFWWQKAFLGNPGLQKSLLTVTVAGVVVVVLLSGALECTRTQWDKLKILRMFGGMYSCGMCPSNLSFLAHAFTGREFTKEHMDGR